MRVKWIVAKAALIGFALARSCHFAQTCSCHKLLFVDRTKNMGGKSMLYRLSIIAALAAAFAYSSPALAQSSNTMMTPHHTHHYMGHHTTKSGGKKGYTGHHITKSGGKKG
jgi:hypothetical protein